MSDKKTQEAAKLISKIYSATLVFVAVLAVIGIIATFTTAKSAGGSATSCNVVDSLVALLGFLVLLPFLWPFLEELVEASASAFSEALRPVRPGLAALRSLLDLYYRGLISREALIAGLKKISRLIAITSERMDPNDPLAKWAVLVALWRRKVLTDAELLDRIEALRSEWGRAATA